jgi:DHA1 family inner membrane transport protein
MPSIGLIAVLWGGTHACGLVASQMWLRSVSHEAHDFASSLYLTAANAGVMSGSLAAGAAIARAGMPGVVWCGLAFCGLAVLVIALKAAIY